MLIVKIFIGVVFLSFSQIFANVAHRDGKIVIWSVLAKESYFKGGSNGQFTGKRKNLSYGIGVFESLLDSDIKRVGFSGFRNDDKFEIEKGRKEGDRLVWTFDFETQNNMLNDNRENVFRGIFFVETVKGSYHRLKHLNGKDFQIDNFTSVNLSDYTPK